MERWDRPRRGRGALDLRRDPFALARGGFLGLGLVGALVFASGIWLDPQSDMADATFSMTPEVELTDTLQRLRLTWEPRATKRILNQAKVEGPRLTPALREVLQQDGHPLLEQAIELAGALGDDDLRPLVVALSESASDSARARAVIAADRLAPWTSDELFDFLTRGGPQVQIAALEIVATRSSAAPWEQALSLLLSEHAEVREAALKAIPRRPPPRAIRGILALLRSGSSDGVVAGLEALSRTEFAEAHERNVTDLLASGDAAVQLSALDLLSKKDSPLDESEVVWAVALDHRTDLSPRAHAMHCLERTRSYDPDRVEDHVGDMEPLTQYFAARCLVLSGRPKGLSILLHLIDAPTSPVVVASRNLLGELTGLSPGATGAQFAGALTSVKLPVETLPPPGFSF